MASVPEGSLKIIYYSLKQKHIYVYTYGFSKELEETAGISKTYLLVQKFDSIS